MATILTSADYPAIRAAIDTSLDADTLTDAVIAMPIYLAAADLDIKALVPTYAAIVVAGGDPATHLTNALVYLTAAKIVPAIPDIVQEKFPDYAYQVQRPKLLDQVRRLTDLAMAEVAIVLGATPASRLPLFFTIARGSRVSRGY